MRWELAWKESYLTFQLSDPPNVFSLYKLVWAGFSETAKIIMAHLLTVENLEISKEKKMHSIYNPNLHTTSYVYGIHRCSHLILFVYVHKCTLKYLNIHFL